MSRCGASRGSLRCSLESGHAGIHVGLFADQTRNVKEPRTIQVAFITREKPEPPPKQRSHHLEHPGGWIPYGHLPLDYLMEEHQQEADL